MTAWRSPVSKRDSDRENSAIDVNGGASTAPIPRAAV